MEQIQPAQPHERLPGPHCTVSVKFSDMLCPAPDASRRGVTDTKGRGSSKLAGTEVRIILPPVPADPELFACGTEWMWEIHPMWLRVLRMKTKDRVFLCRHQLEMD